MIDEIMVLVTIIEIMDQDPVTIMIKTIEMIVLTFETKTFIIDLNTDSLVIVIMVTLVTIVLMIGMFCLSKTVLDKKHCLMTCMKVGLG